MLARINLRKIVAASVLALVAVVGSLGTAGSALAGGCGGYGGYGGYSVGYGGHCHTPAYVPSYRPVVTYRYEQVPYTVCVVRYDHCGNAYHADEVRYRTVQVPVVSRFGY
jgi:hypothetical protein